ncbi:MAG: histidine--tRNA ligase [Candidatus Aenigmatarchaeota archaeon]
MQPPRGTRDFMPEEMVKRNYMFRTISEVFESFGFKPLETPAFESWELLAKKGGGGDEVKNEIYYFKDKSDRELGLRFDLTVPMTRVVASNPQLPKPFKRYQIGRVWRYDRPQAGRFREFWQADVDVVGSASMKADSECLLVAVRALEALGFQKFVVRVNNRKILNGLIELVKIKDRVGVFRSLDKLEKIGKKGVMEELSSKNVSKKDAEKLFSLIELKGKPDDMIKKGRSLLKGIKIAEEGMDELETMITEAKMYEISDYIIFDFSLVRGLDYYTGPIFEVFEKGFENLGSISAGGRYDKMIGMYGRDTPATGISLGIERIYEIMKERKMFKTSGVTKAFVLCMNDSVRKDAIKLSQELRKNNINNEIDLIGRDFRKQLDYANSTNIPFVVFVGEKEVKTKKFTLKDMKSGKQELFSLQDLIKKL